MSLKVKRKDESSDDKIHKLNLKVDTASFFKLCQYKFAILSTTCDKLGTKGLITTYECDKH